MSAAVNQNHLFVITLL